MSEFREENNPRGYWGTKETGWSHSKKLLAYIGETRYPDFNARREVFTKDMQREVMRIYNMFVGKDEEQDERQVNIPSREIFTKPTSWGDAEFEWNDEQYIEYKKELNNK